MPDLHYSHYLRLDNILNSQQPVSASRGTVAHDEMLFIITHQAYELWFKQIIHELDSIIALFDLDRNDNDSGGMCVIVRRVQRIVEIWRLLIAQMDVLETMAPADFLEFRDLLIPASGFQSIQFKLIEAKLGLRAGGRYGGGYYKHVGRGSLSQGDCEKIDAAESEPTLKQQLSNCLERMSCWCPRISPRRFWAVYRRKFLSSLNGYESPLARRQGFDRVFLYEGSGEFSPAAMRAALFIVLYRDYPPFQLPYMLIAALLDVDEYTSAWRHRHLTVVRRMIGLRVGTGGLHKEGKGQGDYLEGALRQHSVFRELTELSTYLIERRSLPPISVNKGKLVNGVYHLDATETREAGLPLPCGENNNEGSRS